MAFMRSTLAYALLWINLISFFLILFFLTGISGNRKVFDYVISYIDLSSFVPILMLSFSFCVTKNECCSPDKEVNKEFAIGSCFGLCLCCGTDRFPEPPRNQSRKKKCCDDCREYIDCGDCNCDGGGKDDCVGCAYFIIILASCFIFICLLN